MFTLLYPDPIQSLGDLMLVGRNNFNPPNENQHHMLDPHSFWNSQLPFSSDPTGIFQLNAYTTLVSWLLKVQW
jgi:hypothetical protein